MKYIIRITLKSGRWLEYEASEAGLKQAKLWYSDPDGILCIGDMELRKIEIRSNEAETISYKEIE